MRRAYDLRAVLAGIEQKYTAEPPEVGAALGFDPELDPTMRFVLTKDAVYQQMPAWPASIRDRWLRHTAAGLSRAGLGEVELGEVFPALLAVLDAARDDPGRPGLPDVAFLLVPAADAFAAFPSSSARKLIAKGADPERLTGDVLFTVRLDAAGRLSRVTADADAVFDQAYEMAGLGQAADLVTAVQADVTLTAHGQPVRIAVPSGRAVMTTREFENAF